MEPFLISCPGCKIRLQITNPDFIGREFACPRCKSRLEVKEPTAEERAAQQREGAVESATGHVTGTFRLGPPKNQSQDATTAIGEFADIESVLSGGAVKPIGKWIEQPQIASALTAEPVAGPSAKRASQQRWMLLVFAVVGGSLAALIITSLVIYVLSPKPEDIAKNPPTAIGDKPPNQEKEKGAQKSGGEATAPDEPGEEKSITIPSDVEQEAGNNEPPTAAPDPTKPPAQESTPGEKESPDAPPGLAPSDAGKSPKADSGASISDALKEGLQGTSLINSPGGGALLKAQGGLLEAPDVDPTIFKPKPHLINVQEQLNEVFAQVRAEKLALVDFLDLLSQLSGAPVSLDPAVYVRAGVDLQAEVNVIAENKNLRQIAETGLRPLGLHLVALGSGYVATHLDNTPPPLNLDGIAFAPQAGVELEKFIKQSVDPRQWDQPQVGAKLSIAGNQIQFQGPARVALGVKNLLEGVRQAAGGQSAPLPSDELLKKPVELKDARTMRLAEWTRKLELAAGCEILIDWVSLGGLGWNLDTMVSQPAQNEPLGEVLKKVCEPRALAFRQLTPGAIEITSFMETYDGAEARVVSIKKQLDAGAPIEKIQTDLAKAIAPAIPRRVDPRSFVQVLKSPPVAAIRGPAAVQVLAEKWLSGDAAAPPPATEAKPAEKPSESPAPISTAGAGS